jgi:hypothetical protein
MEKDHNAGHAAHVRNNTHSSNAVIKTVPPQGVSNTAVGSN